MTITQHETKPWEHHTRAQLISWATDLGIGIADENINRQGVWKLIEAHLREQYPEGCALTVRGQRCGELVVGTCRGMAVDLDACSAHINLYGTLYGRLPDTPTRVATVLQLIDGGDDAGGLLDRVEDAMDAWRNGEGDTDVMEAARERAGTDVTRRAMAMLPTEPEWHAMNTIAEAIQRSNIIAAKKLNTLGDILLVLMSARDLGISATMAIQKIHIIDGRPSLSAELMVGLVRNAGYSIAPGEVTNTSATAIGKRGDEEASFTFTIEDAAQAQLASKDNWKHYPKAMLWARAVSGLCRMLFPDVLSGLTYTPEELGADVDESGEVIEAASWSVPPPGRTAPQAGTQSSPLDAMPKAPNEVIDAFKARIQALSKPAADKLREAWNRFKESHEILPLAYLAESQIELAEELISAAESFDKPPAEQVDDADKPF